jgi:hypothetical protein
LTAAFASMAEAIETNPATASAASLRTQATAAGGNRAIME